MASLAAASRLSLRLAGRPMIRASRGFHSAARLAVAHNFTMPALSPTMTEGSIAAWRVKEGDKFAAGDVLLEIETDKAMMDVEAQEDGQVFKILQGDGSKGVPVGARIGVLAEADDDLATLEMPPDEAPAPVAASTTATASSSSPSEPAKSAPTSTPAPTPTPTTTTKKTTPAPPQKYPLFPSVEQLIKENGLKPSEVVSQMTPTGPGGRLLKGDVLAFLGKVPADVPVALEKRYETLAHLDLSNIKIKAPAPAKAEAKAEAAKAAEVQAVEAEAKAAAAKAAEDKTTVVSLPVSLSAVMDVQGKLQSSLGVFLPVSAFVARATDVANDALPRVGPAPAPTAAELFDEIVSGSSSSPKMPAFTTTRGHYLPQISALPAKALKAQSAAPKTDIFDILTGKVPATTPAVPGRAGRPAAPAVSTGTNFFSVAVPQAEAKRAQVFLERLKTVLETEPGRLVL